MLRSTSAAALVVALTSAIATAIPGAPAADVRAAISAMPLAFVPTDDLDFPGFACQGLDYGLFVDGAGATVVLRGTNGIERRSAEVRIALRDARPGVVPRPETQLSGVSNLYRGTDPSQWRVGVPSFARVLCPQVYPGVDLVYYGSRGELEYDFVVAPGANPRDIAFDLVGAESLRIDPRGDLVATTAAGDLVQRAPIAYQMIGTTRVNVAVEYELHGTTLRFHLGEHDASAPLVIDPVVSLSTFLGGTGADQAWDFDVDQNGNVCVAGYTASVNFPHSSTGALNGFWDMFVAKFDPTGTYLIYSTLLSATGAGTGVTEYATGIACDTSGNVYVTGRTNAVDFPMWNARQPTNAGNTDAVVVKLGAAGQLVFSTYHGGSGNENGRYDSVSRCGKIAVDADRFVYVTGSSNSTDFPLANAFDAVVSGSSCAGGCADMFLSKFTPDGQSLVFSTFIGDTLPEEPVGILVDAARDIYVGGNNGTILVHKVAANGQSLLYSRSLNNGPDGGHSSIAGFDVDSSGRVVLTGTTSSGAYPTTPGTWQPTYAGCFSGTCWEAFVTVLAPNNGPILASSYVGVPTYNEAGTAIRFDRSGDVVFAVRSQNSTGGWFSQLWKLDSGLVQRVALQTICGAGEATDLYVDDANNVRLIGWVWAGSSPASTPGAFQPAHAGNIDVFLSAYDMQSPPSSTPFLLLCPGDGSASACPCANESPAGSAAGCLNSVGLGGKLVSTGLARLTNDTLVLHGSHMPDGPALYFQGTTAAAGGAGVLFGDGLRCATGTLVRLGIKVNVQGSSQLPEPTEGPVSGLGLVSVTGTRTYQAWYRDSAAFCASATYNLTNGGEVLWLP